MLKKYLKNPCNIFFTLYCLYHLQGTLYPSGTIVSRLILLFILLMSIFPTIEMFVHKNNPLYFRGLNALTLMYIIYGVILIIVCGNVIVAADGERYSTFGYLKDYLDSLLPIYACYNYAKKGYLNKKMFQRWVAVFLLVAIAGYYRMEREALEALMTNGSNLEEITNNKGYTLLALIPCMLIYDNKPLLRYLGIGICVFYVIMGMKRGAILCCAFALVMIAWFEMKNAKGSRKLLVTIIIILGIFLLTRLVQGMLANSSYFNRRIEQTIAGESSERDVIYAYFWNAFLNETNIITFLFGKGAYGTLLTLGQFAHNDWLETLTNQGVLGVALFFVYWILFLKTIKNKSYEDRSRFVLILIFCIYGMRTIFSMSIGSMSIYVSSIFGYALANGFQSSSKSINAPPRMI